MDKTVLPYVIIDAVRTENEKTTHIHVPKLNNEEWERMLQDNVKEEDGSIDDKEKALHDYSLKSSGFIGSFTKESAQAGISFAIFLLVILLSVLLVRKQINPNKEIIYIDKVFLWYFVGPLALFLGCLAYKLWRFIKSSKESVDNNKKSFDDFATAWNPCDTIYKCLINIGWAIKKSCHWLKRLFSKENVAESTQSIDESSKNESSNESSAFKVHIVDHMINNTYIKYSALFYWKLAIVLSLFWGAFIPWIRFYTCNFEHDYGFTSTDSWDVPKWVVNVVKITPNGKYFEDLYTKIRNVKKEELVKFYSEKIQKEKTEDQKKELSMSISELNNKLLLSKHKVKYAMEKVSEEYEKTNTNKKFNKLCFRYIGIFLSIPVFLHLIILIIYWIRWEKSKKLLMESCTIHEDEGGNISDDYHNSVLSYLKRQYKRVCEKFIWFHFSYDPDNSIVKNSELKSFCDQENYEFKNNKDAIKHWIDSQNKLTQRPYTRTLVCLCDISQPILSDGIALLSELSNKDKYAIRVALVYDQAFCGEYPNNANKIEEKINLWKSSLLELNKAFSEKITASIYKIGSVKSQLENPYWLNESVKTQHLDLEEAFKEIFEDLELQCKKLVWLQITDHPENSFVKNSDLEHWCDKDKKNNIFLDSVDAIDSWIEKHNKLSVPCHTRTLVCLCDISQQVPSGCINRIAGLANQKCYDIFFALVYDKSFVKNYPNNVIKIDKQLNQWKLKLAFLENGFSKSSVWIPEKELSDFEPEFLFDKIKNEEGESEENLKIEEAFNHIIEQLKQDSTGTDSTGTGSTGTDSTGTDIGTTSTSVQNVNGGLGSTIVDLINKGQDLAGQIKEKAINFIDITPSPLPEPQPYCKTLLIIYGFRKKEQQEFRETFDKYVDDKVKKVPMRWYTDIYDSNIIDDIEAEQTADQNNCCAIYYRIVLIAKISSGFDDTEREQLMNIIKEINDIVQKQPQIQYQPLKVSFVVSTDPVLEKKTNMDVTSKINYYWKDEVFGTLKQISGSNVDFSFEETFNYRDATPNRWTNFCATVFPESDIDIVELPTPEERKKMFSEAIAAIQIASEKAFDNPQNKDACIKQTLQLCKEIHDIYFANVGNNFFQGLLEQAGQTVKDIGGDSMEGCKQLGGKVVEGTKQLRKGFWGFLSNHMPTNGNLIGGSIGVLSFIVPFACASFATGVAVPGVAYALGASALGVLGGVTGGTVEDLWSKSRDYRQKERAEKDAVFREKSEDEQARILQVDSLISNGLTLALIYDGQGYSEDTILETIKQVRQPLEVLYISTKDDVGVLLNVVQSRWEMRCIKNI